MQTLRRINQFISRYIPWFVLASMAFGIFFPDTFSRLKGITVAIVAFITFTNSLSGDFHDLARVARHPLPVLVVFLTSHLLLPALVTGLGKILFASAPLFALGLLLQFSLPTAVTSLMWVGIVGGNISFSLTIVLLDTLLAPVVIPATLRLFAGSVVELDPTSMLSDLLFMVAIPAALAMLLHQFSRKKAEQTLKPLLDPFAKLLLFLLVAINSSSCAPFVRNLNRDILLVILCAMSFCLLGYFLGYWLARAQRQPFSMVLPISLSSGVRNVSVGAVLAAQYFPPEVMLPVSFTPLFSQLSLSIVAKLLLRTKAGRAWCAEQDASQNP